MESITKGHKRQILKRYHIKHIAGTNKQAIYLQAVLTTVHFEECRGTPKVLCGKYKTGRVCGGDSGGSAVADRNGDGVWVQYGIMSYIYGPIGVSYCFELIFLK